MSFVEFKKNLWIFIRFFQKNLWVFTGFFKYIIGYFKNLWVFTGFFEKSDNAKFCFFFPPIRNELSNFSKYSKNYKIYQVFRIQYQILTTVFWILWKIVEVSSLILVAENNLLLSTIRGLHEGITPSTLSGGEVP